MNQAPAHIGERELRDEQLFPFEAAVRRVRASRASCPPTATWTVCPATPRRSCSTGILRDEWGFDGIVASDYIGVEMISTAHKLTADLAEAGAAGARRRRRRGAAAAPSPSGAARGRPRGRPGERRGLDANVARVLRLKFRLGLFDQPYVPIPTRRSSRHWPPTRTVAARALAERSMVLVKNDGILPLAPGPAAGRGHRADRRQRPRPARRLQPPRPHGDAARDARGTDALGIVGDGDVIAPADELAGRRTILDALRDVARRRRGPLRPRHRASPTGATRRSPKRWRSRARRDVAILVLGERSGLTDDSTTGEFRDRSTLGFHGRQQELLDAVVATGTPVVLVVVSGRPLAIESAAGHCHAVLLAWVPGDAGPDAIADVLTGAATPGGKLPVSIPRHVGQVPVTYRHHPTGGHSQPKGDYVDGSVTPLWPFGFGLSYTTFTLDRLRVDRDELATDGASSRSASRSPTPATAPAMRSSSSTSATTRPPSPARSELRGFRRVSLAPGECRTVTFRLSRSSSPTPAPTTGASSSPGPSGSRVGTSSVDLPLTASVTLVGPDDRPPRTAALPDRDRAWLTPGRRSTRPARSPSSTNGSSGRSSSTWAGRSTAGSTSPAIRPPTPTAGVATSST